ncbi:MAG: azurin [Opitutaceae bacterium]|nr:azurin [Opitutaceae bacterium]
MKFRTLLSLFTLTLATLGVAAHAREVAITGNDAMQYSLKEITAAPGEELTVKLTHIGKLPKAAMGHNWVLLKPMTNEQVAKFAMDALKFPPEYLPKDQSTILAHTKIVGGGESDSVSFAAPAQPGEYPFICTFPGHFAVMRGVLIVK